MAYYNVKFACGHEDYVSLTGSIKNHEQWIERAGHSKVCPSCCYKKDREKKQEEHARENEQNAELAKLAGLPDLEGSEKQIAWAITIRANALEKMRKCEAKLKKLLETSPLFSEQAKQEARDALALVLDEDKTNPDAAFWIDNCREPGRRYDPAQVMSGIVRQGLAPTFVAEQSVIRQQRQAERERQQREAEKRQQREEAIIERAKTQLGRNHVTVDDFGRYEVEFEGLRASSGTGFCSGAEARLIRLAQPIADKIHAGGEAARDARAAELAGGAIVTYELTKKRSEPNLTVELDNGATVCGHARKSDRSVNWVTIQADGFGQRKIKDPESRKALTLRAFEVLGW